MKRAWCSAVAGGVRLAVHIMPNAKKTEVTGVLTDDSDEALKIRLHAPPVEGKANEALVRYLSDVLKVPRSAITISHGHLNKRKVLQIQSERLSPALMAALLLPAQ